MMFLFAVIFGIFLAAIIVPSLVLLMLREKSNRIFEVYPTKGVFYIFKYYLVLVMLRYYNKKFSQKREQFSERLRTIDGPQVLGANPKSYDQISFTGANQEGHRFSIYMERRKKGIFYASVYLYVPELGMFASENLPDMMHFSTHDGTDSEGFIAKGFKIYPIEPMKKWKINFDGKLVNKDQLYRVTIDAEFYSTFGHFNYNTDLSPAVIADSTARESWNDDFFNLVRNFGEITKNREHYEQVGFIDGNFSVENYKEYSLKLQGFRDHNYGTERDIETFHRYAYFILFMRNGSYVILGNLSQPSFFLSSLKVGYVCSKDGQYSPIKRCSYELFSYGEKGTPPTHQNFVFETEKQTCLVSIVSEACAEKYVGYDWETKLYNQFVTCSVNYSTGFGFAEYLYRNQSGRPKELEKKDPEWFQKMRAFESSLNSCESDAEDEDL